MSTIKLVFSTLLLSFGLVVTSTYAVTLPVDAEIVPVEIVQSESTLNAGAIRVFTMPGSNAQVGQVVRVSAMATSSANLESLTIYVDGQPIASSTRGAVAGSFTPTQPGIYAVTASAVYTSNAMATFPKYIVVQ